MNKLLRVAVLLMLVPMVLACTCTSLNPGALLGAKGTPTATRRSTGATPTAAKPSTGGAPTAVKPPASGGGVPGNIPPGSFAYEVTNAGPDNKKIDGGVVQDQSTTSEYVIGLAEKGALARYSLTLFIPHDVKPGKITLKAYDKKLAAKGPTTAIFIGAWFYYASSGTLTVDSVADNKITGSFEFKAGREDDPSKTVTVKGAFNQVPLVKK